MAERLAATAGVVVNKELDLCCLVITSGVIINFMRPKPADSLARSSAVSDVRLLLLLLWMVEVVVLVAVVVVAWPTAAAAAAVAAEMEEAEKVVVAGVGKATAVVVEIILLASLPLQPLRAGEAATAAPATALEQVA